MSRDQLLVVGCKHQGRDLGLCHVNWYRSHLVRCLLFSGLMIKFCLQPCTEVAAQLSVRWHEWEAASWKRVERPLQLQNELLPRVEESVGFVFTNEGVRAECVTNRHSAEHKSEAVSLPIKSTLLPSAMITSWGEWHEIMDMITENKYFKLSLLNVAPHAFKSQHSCCSRVFHRTAQ